MDGKRVVITYGTYDLLHFGHSALFERAKALGDYLIVGVTSDAFDRERGKLNVAQSFTERIEAVRATGLPDMVIAEEYQGQKIADIKKYGVDVFAIGSDWTGKFDYLKKYCEVVYLPRTEGVSSTELREQKLPGLAIGCIGADYLMARFMRECRHVSGLSIAGLAPLPGQDAAVFAHEDGFAFCTEDEEDVLLLHDERIPVLSLPDLLEYSDAVYISAIIDKRAALIRAALEAGCHVLCEAPLFLSRSLCEEFFALADAKGLVLMEAVKTRYYPAFDHLKLLVESGVVGEVKDIRASYSHVFAELDKTDIYQGSLYDVASYEFLPAMSLLGPDFLDARIICSYEGDFCTWAKVELLYETAAATLCMGRGMKTEGDMVITGTQGYVYVPSPWWKPDYFEIRYEDLRNTRKFFYECAGEGQRYEVFEFMRRINGRDKGYAPMQSREEVLAVAGLVGRFDAGDVVRLNEGSYRFGGGERVNDR